MADVAPPNCTVTVAVVTLPISYGTIALICVAETYVSGAGTLLKRTLTPPRLVETIPLDVSVRFAGVMGPRLLPKMLTISPGATELVGCKLAALFIELITGVVAALTARFTVICWLPPAMLGEDTLTVPL